MSRVFSRKIQICIGTLLIVSVRLNSYAQVSNLDNPKVESDDEQKKSSTAKQKVSPKVTLKESESLEKIYPFRPEARYYLSSYMTLPLRTYPSALGYGGTFGVKYGLFDMNVSFLSEKRVWRQLEQRPNEDVLKEHRSTFIADDPDARLVSRYATQFLWNEGDPFSLWSIDLGFGARYPTPFLPEGFSSQLNTFVSYGRLRDLRVTLSEYETRGAGILMFLLWKVNFFRGIELKSGLRYSILEASKNGFSKIDDQISIHGLGLVSGVDVFL